ncbi:MAG: hypothetical protein WC979_07250 [Candidatus Pacearchaeota archaeon]|jgi:hypothetical protein
MAKLTNAAVLGIFLLILAVLVAIITVARILFWISAAIFIFGLILLIPAIIADFLRIKNDSFDEGFGENVLGILYTIIILGVLLITWCMAHFFYPIGYSPTSYAILDLNNQVQTVMNLPDQVYLESMNSICKSQPNIYPSCDTYIKTYQAGQTAGEIGDMAKAISWTFKLV